MSRKSRKSRYNGYRSGFEEELAQKLQPRGFNYEPEKIPYTIHRHYTPDFVYDNGERKFYIEAKGFFRIGDTQKYKSIVECLSETEELIFILMKPNQRVSKSTKIRMHEWCDKYKITWYNIDTLEELIEYVNARGN